MASPAPSPAPRPLQHVAGLDGLRGVAVLLVVISHLNIMIPRLDITRIQLVDGFIEGGYLGVDLFFVLSGFLITALLLGEERGTGDIRYGSFYARRAIRLLPALYFMLLCFAVYTLATDLPWPPAAASIQASVLYYYNWLVVLDLGDVATGTNQLWSLAIEEQFYFVWPAILVALLGLRRSARTVTVVLVVAILAVAVHRARLWNDGALWLDLFVRTDTRADTLLVGALLGSLWVRRATPTRGVRPAAWLALAFVAVYLPLVEASSAVPYVWGATAFAEAAGAIVLAVVEGGWAPARLLAARPLVAVGKVSYGLYLWHFPIFHVVWRYGNEWPEGVRVVVGLGGAALATTVSWFYLEVPLQRLRGRYAARPASVA